MTQKYSFTIAVPHDLPTANSRLHWAKRAALTKQAREVVTAQARAKRLRNGPVWAVGTRIVPEATGRCYLHMTLIRGKGQRMLDHDNAVSAMKPVIDGLVSAGWLKDDSFKWLQYDADQRRGPEPAVEVCIRRLDEAVSA